MSHITAIARHILQLGILGTACLTVGFSAIFIYLSPKLPDVDALRDVRLQTPLRIYSRDGLLIGEFGEKRRTPVQYEEVPELFIKAFLAAEDDRFYLHHGVDIAGLLRAASQLIVSGSIQTGGSTITMQVAKNYFLSQERTFSRKFNEIFLALKIERALSKPEILELYINKIFLGNHAYGIEAAAQVYYGKSISELELSQMAMIAGLPKAPSAYNPIVNPQRAKLRRNWILGRMKQLGYIDADSYQTAVSSPVTATYYGSRLQADAAYVAELTRQDMIQRFGLDAYNDGYHVYTTVDSKLQSAANRAVIDGVAAYDWRHGYRGPEQHWPLPDDYSGPATPADSEFPVAPDPWLKKLRGLGTVAIWQPALVIAVEERSVEALLANSERITLGWEQGLSEARRFIDPNRRGKAPQQAADVLKRGDVIRVLPGKAGWQLSQLPQAQSALVSLDADSGAILSLVGGYDYRHSAFNRVTQAQRQPGSNFKPFVYTAALANGFTAATVINDAPIVFEDDQLESTWRPTNDSGKFYGPTRLRQALYNSRNLVSIRLLRELGIANAIDYVARFGFEADKLPRDLSLALGSHSMTPMKVVEGYAVFANGGYKVEPYLIERIEDHDRAEIYRAQPAIVCRECEDDQDNSTDGETASAPIEELATIEAVLAQTGAQEEQSAAPMAERVLDERVAYLIDDILQDVVRKGTARRARQLGRGDLAGKTGTTNGPTDAWFSGYGGGVVTTTWVGFDKNQNLGRREYGGSVALPIWMDYMKVALADRPERQLKQPEGMVSVRIDPRSGRLAKAGQDDAIFEIFRTEQAPQEEVEALTAEHPMAVEQEAVEIF